MQLSLRTSLDVSLQQCFKPKHYMSDSAIRRIGVYSILMTDSNAAYLMLYIFCLDNTKLGTHQ